MLREQIKEILSPSKRPEYYQFDHWELAPGKAADAILSIPELAHYLKLLEETAETCPECDGLGVDTSFSFDPLEMPKGEDCPICHGTGTISHPERIVVLKK